MKQFFADFSPGFSTAIRLWLFFMLVFFFLGYPVTFCILVGGVAGLAGGWVVAWWNTKDDPLALKAELPEEPEEIAPKVSGLRLAKQRRDSKTKQRPQGQTTGLTKLFDRRKKLSRRT